jgi:hypothetical protein
MSEEAKEYVKGASPRLLGVFRDPSTGDLIDPATVKVYVKNPAAVITIKTYITDPEVVKESTGRYHMDVDANVVGRWTYRFESTGTGKAADERDFVVKASKIV